MISEVLDAAARRPELAARIKHYRSIFDDCAVERIGLALDNGPDWLAADLAALADGRVVVPLAPFFSADQLHHALDSSDCQIVLCERTEGARPTWLPDRFQESGARSDCGLWLDQARTARALPRGTFKISYTSGTTGAAKGICLSAALLEQVARALLERTASLGIGRHLCLLPLAVLLENVAGAWAAILGGHDLAVPSQAECGMSGSSGLDPVRWVQCLQRHRPHSIILLPQMLKVLHGLVRIGRYDPTDLRMVAVGGARTPPGLIEAARSAGLPVFEGMTECGSVICLNAPGEDRVGSVGRPLSHQRLTVNSRGEICIHGPHHLGEIGGDEELADPLETRDLGQIDVDGYVHLRGRIGNAYSTAWGRNVSPEWVEAELDAQPEIRQSFVHGRDLPGNLAVIVPSGAGDVDRAVARANARLPDYARIANWCLRRQPFGPNDGTATANNRLRRSRLLQLHRSQLDTLAASVAARPIPSAIEMESLSR
jgi:long-subunit acyl-CoA synthetase (AMP-forming)